MDLQKYKLSLARERLKKAQRKHQSLQEFLNTYQEKMEILRRQLEELDARSIEYSSEIPRLERYITKQKIKVKLLESIIQKEREIEKLRQLQQRQDRNDG